MALGLHLFRHHRQYRYQRLHLFLIQPSQLSESQKVLSWLMPWQMVK
jgi:hypothetical protein